MIGYINLLLLLTMFGSTCYVYYRMKKIFYLISIVMDSEILDQLTDLGRDVDSEFPKPKRGHKKKADPKINEFEDNDVRDKGEGLVACVLSGNSKMYLGKEYTEEQINKMDWCTFQILGVSGSEDRGGGDNSIQFINFGRVGDKSFKEWRQKIGGWKGG